MVHALKLAQQHLTPDGLLIDIHPNGEPAPITVQLGESRHLVGWVREESDYQTYAQADEALATAVAKGWFHWQKQDTFAFVTTVESVAALQQYLAENWTDAYVEDLVIRRMEDLLHSANPDQAIILEEIVRIASLRPIFST